MNKIETFTIESFDDYIMDIAIDIELEDESEHSNFQKLYRGQPCDKPLLPKIARSNSFSILKEKDIIEEFKLKCQSFIDTSNYTELDYLALAQHHGLHTRLLDWTENALVALWFACKEDIPEKEVGVVWSYNVNMTPKLLIEDKNINHSPYQITKTTLYRPAHKSSRLNRQSAWFTVHWYNGETRRFVPLERNKHYYISLKKTIIPPILFPEIRVMLDNLGVNASSVFPDLNGLSDYITWKKTQRKIDIKKLKDRIPPIEE